MAPRARLARLERWGNCGIAHRNDVDAVHQNRLWEGERKGWGGSAMHDRMTLAQQKERERERERKGERGGMGCCMRGPSTHSG
jgi:hypothetical protein